MHARDLVGRVATAGSMGANADVGDLDAVIRIGSRVELHAAAAGAAGCVKSPVDALAPGLQLSITKRSAFDKCSGNTVQAGAAKSTVAHCVNNGTPIRGDIDGI